MFLEDFVEELLPRIAAGGFNVSSREECSSVKVFQSELLREFCGERLVFVGCWSTQTVVQMRDRDFISEFLQGKRHTDGVRAAGYSGQNAVVRNKHVVFVDGLADLCDKFRKHGKCRRADSNRRPKDYETFALTT